jgi:hypothetical protein
MSNENNEKLVETINQLIRKVNHLTEEVNQLKQSKHKQYVKNMDIGLDYTGSRSSHPKVETQKTEGTYPPVDTAPEWRVEFISQIVKPNGEDGVVCMDFSQQAFSEKQAIFLCRKDSYWPTMNQLVKIKEYKSYKEVEVTASKY